MRDFASPTTYAYDSLSRAQSITHQDINGATCNSSTRPFLIVTVLLISIGCRDPVTWSAESRSHDGMWVATAKTVEHGGFGTAGVETTVEMSKPNGSGSPERVLAFADGGRDIGLKMRWDSPSHLVVEYKANPVLLYFQVVKTSSARP